ATLSRMRLQAATYWSPASVRVSLRVERTNKRVFRCASRSATLRLTVGSGTPSLRPTAEKLPSSADATRIAIASRRSILALSFHERVSPKTIRLLAVAVGLTSGSKRADARAAPPTESPNGKWICRHVRDANREGRTGRQRERGAVGQFARAPRAT